MSNSVPDGWRPSKIGEFAKEVKAKNSDQRPIPVLSVTKYKGFVLSLDYFKKQVFSRDTNTYKVVKKGQFAYATIHLDEGSLGLLSEVPEGQVSPMYTVFKTGNDIDKTYLFNLLKSDEFMNIYPALGQGSIDRRASIPFKVLADVGFSCPPLPEQQKIAAILSSVDDVIEKTRAQIDKLKDLKTGMMQELLTKGIGHTAFKDSPVGRIPEGWEVVPLEELCSKISVGIASSTTHAYVDRGVPILRNQNILEGSIRPTDMLHISHQFSDENSSKKIREGDVLTVRTGYPGVSAVVPKEFDGCHSFTTLISRPKKRELKPEYLALLINSDYGKHFVVGGQAGGAQQNLNATILKKFPVILPSLEEQIAIFNMVNSASTKIVCIEKKYRSLLSIKKALMQDLLTGKVRVNVDNKETAVA